MKVLFVSRGNKEEGLSPIIKNHGQSLVNQGLSVDYFTINGKGIRAYLRHVFILRKHLKRNKYDIIHSHYSLTSYVASLALAKPLVVSLMGSDAKEYKLSHFVIRFFYFFFWTKTIVKSDDMKHELGIEKLHVIPNGVDLKGLQVLEKRRCQEILGWDSGKLHVLFGADPNRKEKNYVLAQKALEIVWLESNNVELHILKNIPNCDISYYLNACDTLVLTSLLEGSPNIVKEAMSCNCPVVCTDVGDVRWLFGDTEGCYISSFEPENVAGKIKNAISFGKKTAGRSRIIELGLDSETVAKRIIDVYLNVLTK